MQPRGGNLNGKKIKLRGDTSTGVSTADSLCCTTETYTTLQSIKKKNTFIQEGELGWGTHVNPWLIHVNVWQKPLQCCKVIGLQLIKINGKK